MATVMRIRNTIRYTCLFFHLETIPTYYSVIITGDKAPCFRYADFTGLQHKKEVPCRLQEQANSTYLPIPKTIKQWSDRKKKISFPLFSCKAVPIPNKQRQMVKNLLKQDIEIEEVEDKLYSGAKVEITACPLIGVYGESIDFTGKKRVIIRHDELRKSIVISVPIDLLRIIN